MYLELLDESTGSVRVYKVLASAALNGSTYVLLQKANLDLKAEIHEVLGQLEDGASIRPIEDEGEWRKIKSLFEDQQ